MKCEGFKLLNSRKVNNSKLIGGITVVRDYGTNLYDKRMLTNNEKAISALKFIS
jgi:hypothetical protein